MALSISVERYQQIRAATAKRRAEALVTEIAATGWTDQRRISDVDEFLEFADTLVGQADSPSRRSRKHR